MCPYPLTAAISCSLVPPVILSVAQSCSPAKPLDLCSGGVPLPQEDDAPDPPFYFQAGYTL